MKSDTAILTIAIPTYNRVSRLQAQIERLLPQLKPGVRLCIFDNASSDSTREVVEGYAAQGVEYAPAKCNGGAGWNFARCIGESQSEWVWILSDDDPVCETAVDELLGLLSTNQTCDFIHAFPGLYTDEAVVSDIPSLFQKTGFNQLLWISTCIYRTDAFLPLLEVFHESIFTWAPQVVVVLRLLESGKGKVLLSPANLFGPLGRPAEWSPLGFLSRVSIAPEFLVHPAHQQLLAQDLFISTYTTLLLKGLKATTLPGGLQKWRRIRRHAFCQLKLYYRGGILKLIAANGFREGNRRISLRLLQQSALLQLLDLCPDFAFCHLAKILLRSERPSSSLQEK